MQKEELMREVQELKVADNQIIVEEEKRVSNFY